MNRLIIVLILLTASLYYSNTRYKPYIIMDKFQDINREVMIKKISLPKGGQITIRSSDEYGRPSPYLFSIFYLSPGTYKNLTIELTNPAPINVESTNLHYQPLDLIEIDDNLFKYIPKAGDEFFVVLEEPTGEGGARPIRNFLGKPIQKSFTLKVQDE